ITHTTKEGLKKQRKKLKQTKIEPKNLFDYAEEATNNFIKKKTINAVDNFAKNPIFQELDKRKQEAILSLKQIIPEQIPNDVVIDSEAFVNVLKHFSDKEDRKHREQYLKLFNLTREQPNITLKILSKNQPRTEYIKAFQHKDNKDLYYIAITENSDKTIITGIPTTNIRKVINDIANSEEVIAGASGVVTYPAKPSNAPTFKGDSTPNHLKKPLDFESFHDEEKSLRTRFKDNIEA
ncbi:hypothetical protein CCZ01_09870, partial [Helicobacter monodelphidis]|uniref:hypothetical protein n=1 Tax=Helicobacter sp. 15-1451 TaxID=2004995 RepID=UPI000DCEFF4C